MRYLIICQLVLVFVAQSVAVTYMINSTFSFDNGTKFIHRTQLTLQAYSDYNARHIGDPEIIVYVTPGLTTNPIVLMTGKYMLKNGVYFAIPSGTLHFEGTGPGVTLECKDNITLINVQGCNNFVFDNIELTNCNDYLGNGAISLHNTTSARITNSNFNDNFAEVLAGVIEAGSLTNLLIENCTFANNEGTYGGALSLGGVQNYTIRNVVFRGNKAGTNGGAVLCDHRTPFDFGLWSNVTFDSNSAGTISGAINLVLYNTSPLIMENVTFRNNSAVSGCGTLNVEGGGNVSLHNISCIGNKISSGSTYYFGSMMRFNGAQATRIIDSYFYGNVEGVGTVYYTTTVGNNHIINNTVFDSNKVDGNIYTYASNIYIDKSKIINTINITYGYGTLFVSTPNVTISRTIITGNGGPGVSCKNSTISLDRASIFNNALLDFGCDSYCTLPSLLYCNIPCQRDNCSVCDGSNSCLGCDNVAFSEKTIDSCGICGGHNVSCVGCDGVIYSNKSIDYCGVCGGNNRTCIGCDGVLNSNKTIDNCGVCGGNCNSNYMQSSNKSHNKIPIIVGAAGGGGLLVIIIAVVLLVLLLKRKNKNRRGGEEETYDNSVRMSNYAPMSHSTPYGQFDASPNLPPTTPRKSQITTTIEDKYNLDYSEIVFEKPLGEGSFGIVWKCSWRSSPVAVKQVKDHSKFSDKQISEFLAEANIMRNMRTHRNVVALLGMCSDPICIVTEFCDGGSLLNYLQSNKPLDISKKKQILKDVAAGMVHLEKENIVHRDLAARNVLLTEGMIAKVSDFGLSRISEKETGVSTTATFGPLKWWSYETLLNQTFTHASNVWSFGVLCIEVLTKGPPYPDLPTEIFALKVIPQKLTPVSQIPLDTPSDLAGLVTRCFDFDPQNRPTFQQIYNSL